MLTTESRERFNSSLSPLVKEQVSAVMYSLARHTAMQIQVLSDDTLEYAALLARDFVDDVVNALKETFREMPYTDVDETIEDAVYRQQILKGRGARKEG